MEARKVTVQSSPSIEQQIMQVRERLRHGKSKNMSFLGFNSRDFPGGPVVKNLLCNAGDVGTIPGQGTKIPHASKQLRLPILTTEPKHHNQRTCVLSRKILPSTTNTQHSQRSKLVKNSSKGFQFTQSPSSHVFLPTSNSLTRSLFLLTRPV